MDPILDRLARKRRGRDPGVLGGGAVGRGGGLERDPAGREHDNELVHDPARAVEDRVGLAALEPADRVPGALGKPGNR